MTNRQVYEYTLIELNKVQAPVLLLEDYNYLSNKAVGQYTNKIYNLYDINQQKSDDLRVLKSTAVLGLDSPTTPTVSTLLSNVYTTNLPDDYLHILNCVVEFKIRENYQCYVKDDLVYFGAKRLTADMFPQLIHNYYMKPGFKNPYYYINNVANDIVHPINEVPSPVDSINDPIFEKNVGFRYGNKSKVRLEIRYGKDNSVFVPNSVYVDYLRSPQFLLLTQEDLDAIVDTSQLLEFPDYVCQEIINELVKLVMENASDPRLQTNIPINQSIAGPSQSK